MYAGRVRPVGRERQSARGTGPVVATVGTLGLHVAIRMERGRSQRGVYCSSFPSPLLLMCFTWSSEGDPARVDENKPPKRQLASLSAKVQVYEKAIRNISLSFGLTDEQVINGAMTIVCIWHLLVRRLAFPYLSLSSFLKF
jgi:hypothetical protein